MKYPMKEVFDGYGSVSYVEMTESEYEETLCHYRNIMEQSLTSTLRRKREYAHYLQNWFGEAPCDGLPNFKARYNLHNLPMAYNIYFG